MFSLSKTKTKIKFYRRKLLSVKLQLIIILNIHIRICNRNGLFCVPEVSAIACTESLSPIKMTRNYTNLLPFLVSCNLEKTQTVVEIIGLVIQ